MSTRSAADEEAASQEHKHLFFDDYSEGAHPDILDVLQETNLQQERGYGLDRLSARAVQLIHAALKDRSAAIHFVSGGTQANLVVLAALLKPYESVVAAGTAHIFVHEAGAIEATGHRVQTIHAPLGKLTVQSLKPVIEAHSDEHMVKPRAVFISQPTELGTIYTKSELRALYRFCRHHDLYLYIDGARLGSALAAKESKLTFADLPALCDVFYIGATKNGGLFGEAIVIVNERLKQDFRYHLKQRGALLAKGRAIAAQFIALFANGLYLKNAEHANEMASKLAAGIEACGYGFLTNCVTNQIFPVFPNRVVEALRKDYGFHSWLSVGQERTAVRLVTSWATEEAAVDDFLADLKACS
ncbi:MAG TPA: aminotransferase class I/II-fold pyridoxal phosphate-dependent enzyme [Hyphomicrobiales bacterium]|nr:aminotransferase class I/II-fold pyridoxal phosphate-dependent enzyme [Hyphomicrobiales bacterium]